ncbi:MAG TPA: hypothetical protein VLW50_20785 [Streptosporangiaceae bacterium]|nr:hypothetical protein [Streptosporangiaceae bacterium]
MSSISASGGRRGGTVALAVVAAVIALLFAIAGAIYLTKTAATIPSFLPGKDLAKTKSHHTIRGVGALVVAVALFVVAGISVARSGKAKTAAGG